MAHMTYTCHDDMYMCVWHIWHDGACAQRALGASAAPARRCNASASCGSAAAAAARQRQLAARQRVAAAGRRRAGAKRSLRAVHCMQTAAELDDLAPTCQDLSDLPEQHFYILLRLLDSRKINQCCVVYRPWGWGLPAGMAV
jgi:hypothetical protein